jgi:tetratricopeptide (TPR) repeat protein
MFEEAQSFFKKAMALGPNLLQARFELGRAYLRAGRRDDALATWRAGYAANKLNAWGKRCGEAVDAIENGRAP